MHLEKVKIWAGVKARVKARDRAWAEAVERAAIKAVLSAPVDFVFAQNVAKKPRTKEELNALP